MRQEKHMQKGMRSALSGPMLGTALLAGFICLAFPAWTLAESHHNGGLGRQASTGVETTLLEVVTFVDGEFAQATEPGQLLFEGHTDGHKPVLAPPYDVADDQRQQLTLDDFDNVSGTMQIQEVFEGTRVTFELTGLIPGGVYTLWADYYSAPGLTDDFAHGQALGALGAADGTENTLTAGADGSITFNAVMPAGPLSWFTIEDGFESPSYVLDATVGQFVVWGAYHIDGKTWGPVPDAEGVMDETWVAHFVAVVGPEFPVRQASAPVETSVHLEVGTFVGDEFVSPTEPGQLLFEDHTEARKPVLAPPYDVADDQRQQLTWGDFNNVTGTTTLQETLDGTRVTFELIGLIPNGVYTLWADFYAAPGLTADFAHDQAFGALGSPDGTDNTFTAAEDGTILFTAVQPAGPLSWFTFVEGFEAPLYALDAPVAQFVVWGAYHIDGKSWGPYAGQDGAFDETWVGHFVTVVGPETPVRQAEASVDTTLLEVGTFAGGEFAQAMEPGQLLFEAHTDGHMPVLAPPYDVADDQRQQLTLDDFDNVSGTMQIQEVLEGTRVTFELTGLISGGVYTLWADYYAAPGLTDDYAHEQALGALGAADGSENSFTAAADGSITFTTIMPAGPLSWVTIEEGFEAPSYALDAPVAQFVVWGAYHIDGKTWGPVPDADGVMDETWVAHFVAVVGPE